MASSWTTKRRHSSQPRKTLPSCKKVNPLHSASISIDRPGVLWLWELNSSASIPSAGRYVYPRFPDPPQTVLSCFFPTQPKKLFALASPTTPTPPHLSLFPPPLSH